MAEGQPPSRRTALIEIAVVIALVTLVALYALWRMDYFRAGTQHHVRMTDNSRSAYVAKNLADGNGYTTNDLPASLLDFYDERGKLHDEHWANADRFPFTAYAIAALYKVTGSTSSFTGILVYNLICFVAFMAVLYRLARVVWGDRYSAVLTVGIAMLHPYTYVYLYLKDADMLLLSSGALLLLYRYFSRPPGEMTWKLGLALGTVLTWLFLDRPNVGAPFILVFAVVTLRRLWIARKERGFVPALKATLAREGVAAAVAIVWLLPFVIHSMHEWGSPLFSANNLYQLPLGTRFGMGTDTWWKYTDPAQSLSFSMVMNGAGDQLWSKMTSSWISTIKLFVGTFAIELYLAIGLGVWLGRKRVAGDDARRPLRLIALTTGFAIVMNLALLPLYGYQNYAYRHYLGFALPLIWLGAGRALYLLGAAARPAYDRLVQHWRDHRSAWVLVAIVGVLAWNFGAWAFDGNALFVRTSKFVAFHWLTGSLVLLALLLHRWIWRAPLFPRVVALLVILVIARSRPNEEVKRLSLNFFPANPQVWSVLRERKGIVSSFALQGEVAWASDRKNIPAPEFPMHLYSYHFDHELEIEDVYIESAETMLGKFDGAFAKAAPGFEGYRRLERFRGRLPGYEVVFHEATSRGYPRYNVKPRPKASTIYRLTDRDAIEAMRHSPDRIELGDVANVIYTAHGFGDYFTIDGRPAVAATDSTRARYTAKDEQPFEDTGVTFFLDERRPNRVELDVYAPYAMTMDAYWNLDLYAYDRAADRGAHRIGSFSVPTPGWKHVVLDVPAGLTRAGLNKLGFKASGYQQVVICPTTTTDEACLGSKPFDEAADPKAGTRPLRLEGATAVTTPRISLFFGALAFDYPSVS